MKTYAIHNDFQIYWNYSGILINTEQGGKFYPCDILEEDDVPVFIFYYQMLGGAI